MKMTLSIVLVMPSYLLKNEIKSKIKTTDQPKNQPTRKQTKTHHHHQQKKPPPQKQSVASCPGGISGYTAVSLP